MVRYIHFLIFYNPSQVGRNICNLLTFKSGSDFRRPRLNSFVVMTRLSLQRGEEKAMGIIHLRVRFPDRLNEVLVDDVEGTELMIESIISTALLEVLGAVDVENVTLQRVSERDDKY